MVDLNNKNIDTSIKVLVVDDYTLTRTMVQSILKSAGFSHIRQADSGTSALKRLEEDTYGLVICDWNMPDGNGLYVLEQVRKGGPNQNVLWLMLTAEGSRENVEQAIQAGTSSFVVKPFTADVLLEKVYELCAGNHGSR